MHILHIITKADLGGAQNVTFNLIYGFYSRPDYKITLITGEQGPLVEKSKSLGIETIVVDALSRNISLYKDITAYWKLKKIIRKRQPDIIQLHSSKAGIIGRLLTNSLNMKSIFTVHGWSFKRNPGSLMSKIFLLLEKRFAKITDYIAVVSDNDYQLARTHNINARKGVILIKNGVDDSKHLAQPDVVKNGKTVISMVARFSEQKDQLTLIEAIKNIEGDIEVWLIGDGPDINKIKNKITEEKLSEIVTRIGPSQQVDKLLAESHIGVLCTHWEGLPISVIEFMRAGLPIIASDVGGINELIKHGRNGYLVLAKDIKNVNRYLNRLISQPQLRQKLGANNRQDYISDYSINTMIARYDHLYKEVLKR